MLSLARRRLKKLFSDPQGFLVQSHHVPLRVLGGVLARRLDAGIRRQSAAAAGMTVGVIVTAHDAAGWIEAALASLAGQTHALLDIIVVDDASTDATAAIVARIAARDRRFRLVSNLRNCGPYRSRNRALALLDTPFVTFQDSDDIAHRERIARQLGFLLLDKAALACVCSGLRVNAAGAAIRINGRAERMEASTLFFHRAPIVQTIGFFDGVRFAGDAEYAGRITAAFGPRAIGRQHEVLLTASFREGSLTRVGPGAQVWTQGSAADDWLRTNSPGRIAYAQAFALWHDQIRAGRASPFCPADPLIRPFAAPGAVLADPGGSDMP